MAIAPPTTAPPPPGPLPPSPPPSAPPPPPDQLGLGETGSPSVGNTSEIASTNGSVYPIVEDKTTNQGRGKAVGRIRTFDEDNENAARRIQIQATQRTIVQTQSDNTEATEGIPTSTVATNITTDSSSTEVAASAALTRVLSIKPKDTADNTRSGQKLQQKCNHAFSKIINRCVYCNRKRSSHIHN